VHLVSTLLLTDARTLERRKVFLLGTYGNELLVHFLEKGAGSTSAMREKVLCMSLMARRERQFQQVQPSGNRGNFHVYNAVLSGGAV
jgi:hypothetical protein